MDEKEVVRLIGQYLHERGFRASLEALQTESGRTFNPQTMAKKTGELQSILDEHVRMEENRQRSAINLEKLFQPGNEEYANKLWCSYDDLTGGVNVLVVRLAHNGGSYDHSVCIYRARDDSSGLYELIKTLKFGGAVEGMDFAKDSDVIVIGVREDNLLHCYDLSSDKQEETRTINLNEFGDDYVSFVPLHISFSPDGLYLLVSTDRDRLIMYSWKTGTLIGNFYGASNDEYSQPRHCWDPSGKYIYSTSQDKCIVVWEIRSQSVVARLEGHSGTVVSSSNKPPIPQLWPSLKPIKVYSYMPGLPKSARTKAS